MSTRSGTLNDVYVQNTEMTKNSMEDPEIIADEISSKKSSDSLRNINVQI